MYLQTLLCACTSACWALPSSPDRPGGWSRERETKKLSWWSSRPSGSSTPCWPSWLSSSNRFEQFQTGLTSASTCHCVRDVTILSLMRWRLSKRVYWPRRKPLKIIYPFWQQRWGKRWSCYCWEGSVCIRRGIFNKYKNFVTVILVTITISHLPFLIASGVEGTSISWDRDTASGQDTPAGSEPSPSQDTEQCDVLPSLPPHPLPPLLSF